MKSLLQIVGTVALAYIALFVPLGQWTLLEHTVRIIRSDEMGELGRSAKSAATRVGDNVAREIDERVSPTNYQPAKDRPFVWRYEPDPSTKGRRARRTRP